MQWLIRLHPHRYVIGAVLGYDETQRVDARSIEECPLNMLFLCASALGKKAKYAMISGGYRESFKRKKELWNTRLL